MKVRCKTQCQKDRKILFKVNEEYDIDKEMYQKNKEFFEKNDFCKTYLDNSSN